MCFGYLAKTYFYDTWQQLSGVALWSNPNFRFLVSRKCLPRMSGYYASWTHWGETNFHLFSFGEKHVLVPKNTMRNRRQYAQVCFEFKYYVISQIYHYRSKVNITDLGFQVVCNYNKRTLHCSLKIWILSFRCRVENFFTHSLCLFLHIFL